MVTQFNNPIPINKIISQIMTGKAPLKKKHNKRSLTSLVPKPHYFARPKRFGPRGQSENVRGPFPTRLLRIRHRSEVN